MLGSEVHNEYRRYYNEMFPHIIVVISEITPRNDNKETDVLTCNQLLAESVKHLSKTFLVKHDNLRDESWSNYKDTKHIQKESIGFFAFNIKYLITVSNHSQF